MNIERGNIYRVNLDPTIGSEQQGNPRPCVVLTLTAYNRQLRRVGVVPLTSSPRPLAPLIVPVPSAGTTDAMALCHQIRTIDKARIVQLLGALSPADQIRRSGFLTPSSRTQLCNYCYLLNSCLRPYSLGWRPKILIKTDRSPASPYPAGMPGSDTVVL